MKALEIIFVIVLVIFGTGKLRTAGSDLAAAIRGFRSALRGPVRKPAPVVPPAADAPPDAEFPEARSRSGRSST